MRRIGGIALTVTGFLACPCHLIITLPLLLSLLAGTALGSFLSRNTGLVHRSEHLLRGRACSGGLPPIASETTREPERTSLPHLHPRGCI